MQKPKIISIVGLTASGKSSLGIKIAQLYNGEIISADSRQVYKGIDLNSGKVTKEEQIMAVHHLLDIACPIEYSRENKFYDVFAFQKAAYTIIDDILSRGRVPIIIGGTGLYSRAVVENYDFNEKNVVNESKYNVLQICLMPDKEWLRPRIEQRIDDRLGDGMLDETKGILESGVRADWLKCLGLDCKWNTKLVLGEVGFDEYRYWYGVRTAQFAKRQRTWFKREKNTFFLENPSEFEIKSVRLVKDFLG